MEDCVVVAGRALIACRFVSICGAVVAAYFWWAADEPAIGWLSIALTVPFAVTAYVLKDPAKSTELPTWSCPACAESILVEASVCKHCGAKLEDYDDEPSPV
jgi:hypothetical protein